MRTILALITLAASPLLTQPAAGQSPASPPAAATTPAAQAASSAAPTRVYGWQLMTPDERTAYRAKMRSFHTDAERKAFRAEHHKLMVARAKERGVTLPDDPPARRGARAGAGLGRGACCTGTPPNPPQ